MYNTKDEALKHARRNESSIIGLVLKFFKRDKAPSRIKTAEAIAFDKELRDFLNSDTGGVCYISINDTLVDPAKVIKTRPLTIYQM